MDDTYCSLSFDKENKVSVKLCLTKSDIDIIKSNPKLSTEEKVKELENKYDNPYALLENINNTELIDKIKFDNLKPVAAVDKYTWLNNSQLDQIQEHFNKYYKYYKYSYVHMADLVMIDHQNIKHIKDDIFSVKELDFVKVLKEDSNFKYYGVIFNTDTSDKGGQHWFSIFMDFSSEGTHNNPWTIEYFNSVGTKIMSNLKEFFIKLALTISKELNKTCVFVQVTNIQHQASNTGTCGIYSLFYIFSRLQGVPYKDFNEKQFKVDDNIIVQIRQKFFNDEKKINN
jgi:hypothetical protein